MCITRVLHQCRQSPLWEHPIYLAAIEKIKLVAAAYLVGIALDVNPIICGSFLLLGYFVPHVTHITIKEGIVDDYIKFPKFIGCAIAICVFCSPHFGILAISSTYCAYTSSRFKMYLRNDSLRD